MIEIHGRHGYNSQSINKTVLCKKEGIYFALKLQERWLKGETLLLTVFEI